MNEFDLPLNQLNYTKILINNRFYSEYHHNIIEPYTGFYVDYETSQLIKTSNFDKCEYVNTTQLNQRIFIGINTWIC